MDCLELAVPFPNSPSDGPVIRESADRALADGVDRDAVFAFVQSVRPQLAHLKIALLADWSYSIKDLPVREFVERVQGAGADGLLVHGMPPRLRARLLRDRSGRRPADRDHVLLELAAGRHRRGGRQRLGLHLSRVGVRARAAPSGRPTTAHWRRSSQTLRARTDIPIAVGFGVKTQGDIEALGAVGADAAIVGSACVACVADALANGRDVVEDFQALLVELGAAPQLTGAGLPE